MRDTHTTFTVEPKLLTVEKSIITMHVHKVGVVPRDPTLPVFRATEELPRELLFFYSFSFYSFLARKRKSRFRNQTIISSNPCGSAVQRSIVNSYTLPGEREAPLFRTVAREYKGSRVRAFFCCCCCYWGAGGGRHAHLKRFKGDMGAAAPPKRMD